MCIRDSDRPDYSIEEMIEILTEKRDSLTEATSELIDILGELV